MAKCCARVKETGSTLYETLDILGVDREKLAQVDVQVLGPGASAWLSTGLFTLLPLLLLGWLFIT